MIKKQKRFQSFLQLTLVWRGFKPKELSHSMHKLKFSNTSNIFATWWCKPLIFQSTNIWSDKDHHFKYQWSTTSCCKVILTRKLRVCGKDSILFLFHFHCIIHFKSYVYLSSFLKDNCIVRSSILVGWKTPPLTSTPWLMRF